MHDLAGLQKRSTVDILADIANKGDGGWRVAVGPTGELGSHRVLRLVAVDTKSKGCWNGEGLEVRRVPSSWDEARAASDFAEELDMTAVNPKRAAEARTLPESMLVEEGLVAMLKQCRDFLEEAES